VSWTHQTHNGFGPHKERINPSVSLSLTLSKNEKVEPHLRKKTHKPNALKFWVEGGVISLYVWLLSHFVCLPSVSPLGISSPRLVNKLNLTLTVVPHPRSYKLHWLTKEVYIHVKNQVKVKLGVRSCKEHYHLKMCHSLFHARQLLW